MHARHSHTDDFDEYYGHRAMQGYSLAQFIKHTSQTCDVVIAAGDFNAKPHDVAYKVMKSVATLNDAWLMHVSEDC